MLVFTAAAAFLNQTRPRDTSTYCCRHHFSSAFVVFLKVGKSYNFFISSNLISDATTLVVPRYLQVISSAVALCLNTTTVCKSFQVVLRLFWFNIIICKSCCPIRRFSSSVDHQQQNIGNKHKVVVLKKFRCKT
ncbi:hypothetical protein PS15m_012390 [Mucor circinelloides]